MKNLETGDVIQFNGEPHRVVRAIHVPRVEEHTVYEITPESLEPTNKIEVVRADQCQPL